MLMHVNLKTNIGTTYLVIIDLRNNVILQNTKLTDEK